MVRSCHAQRRGRRQADRRRRRRLSLVLYRRQETPAARHARGGSRRSSDSLRFRRHQDARSMTQMPPLALLAGGLAKRLRPLSESVAKVMAEVAGEPFIAHQLRLARRESITHVVLCVAISGRRAKILSGKGAQLGLRWTTATTVRCCLAPAAHYAAPSASSERNFW